MGSSTTTTTTGPKTAETLAGKDLRLASCTNRCTNWCQQTEPKFNPFDAATKTTGIRRVCRPRKWIAEIEARDSRAWRISARRPRKESSASVMLRGGGASFQGKLDLWKVERKAKRVIRRDGIAFPLKDEIIPCVKCSAKIDWPVPSFSSSRADRRMKRSAERGENGTG